MYMGGAETLRAYSRHCQYPQTNCEWV